MTIKYLIVEDEERASEMLIEAIASIRPDYMPIGVCVSVAETVTLLKKHSPDLIFMDIELADGNCFDIFKLCDVDTPVIFATAYNDYATQAFKVNSIDYILKPVDSEDLTIAIEKFESRRERTREQFDYRKLEGLLSGRKKRNRILISKGDTYKYMDMSDVAFFSVEDKYIFLHTFSGESHITDYTLTRLEDSLKEEDFFRLSRNHIVNICAVGEIAKYFNWRLKVTLNVPDSPEIIVSAARRDDFLNWVGGK